MKKIIPIVELFNIKQIADVLEVNVEQVPSIIRSYLKDVYKMDDGLYLDKRTLIELYNEWIRAIDDVYYDTIFSYDEF